MPELLVLFLMQVTVFSSVTAIILIAVKQIFKCRIPPRIGVVLWVILLARLLCPILPESKVSVYNFIPIGRNIMYTLTNDIEDGITEQEQLRANETNPYVLQRSGSETDGVMPEATAQTEDTLTVSEYFAEVVNDADSTYSVTRSTELVNIVILGVYLSGVIVTLSVNCLLYHRSKRRVFLSSYLCTDEWLLKTYNEAAEKLGIREDKVPPLRCGLSSMLVGIVSCQVVCREDVDKKEAPMVFAHELLHFKYRDNPILWFSTIVTCLFWYNPLIWVVRNMLREDVEVLCDSRTLTYLRIPHTEYAYLLCQSSAFAELAVGAGCHMSATGRRLKYRLRTLSSEKHKRFLPKFASALLCAAIMMVCLTNPIISQNSDYSVYIENYAELTGEDERAMHLSQEETVSSYLDRICTLLDELCDESLRSVIGNGSLENFKRICQTSEYISSDLRTSISNLRSDEPLTVRSCAVINDCAAALLEGDNYGVEADIQLLPKMITEADMNKVTADLTVAEREAVLGCYNKGVAGAEVKFDYVYTDAMMQLIADRINDEWFEAKFFGFYQKIDLSKASSVDYIDQLQAVIDTARNVESIYACDPSVNSIETKTLRNIIGAAAAGQQENVYYLKNTEDGHSFGTAERIFKKSGFTVADMLAGYAEIGERVDPFDSDVIVYTAVRDFEADAVRITGTSLEPVKEAVRNAYSLGLIDASEDGTIDLTERLSCGQGIYYAYKLVTSAVTK